MKTRLITVLAMVISIAVVGCATFTIESNITRKASGMTPAKGNAAEEFVRKSRIPEAEKRVLERDICKKVISNSNGDEREITFRQWGINSMDNMSTAAEAEVMSRSGGNSSTSNRNGLPDGYWYDSASGMYVAPNGIYCGKTIPKRAW